MDRKVFFLFLVFLILAVTPSFATEKVKVPEPLKPWVDWVLHDHQEELSCTANYNNSNNLRCNWPSSLDLEISSGKGSFKQSWYLEDESWIQLPGNEKVWPVKVSINDKAATVLKRQGVPQVKLPAGNYRIKGSFSWSSMPEFLQINRQTGLLSLKVNGKRIDFPNLDDGGRVWLHARGEDKKVIEDRLQLQVFRMIDDRIPARVVLQLNLDVAGTAREVLLGASLAPENFIPVSLSSSLPARLEKDGRIRLQVRPGQWQISLVSRHIGPLTALTFNKPDDGVWPEEEIWVFSKQNNRIVEITGATPIDPQQTLLPPNWRSLPAYRLLAGEVMKFKEIKRGDPRPAPDQLSLQRNLWLRFDGSGYTIQDQISGRKTSNWRLEMTPPLELGRVAIDGAEQFITKRSGSENTGIELRKGVIQLSADSVYLGPIGKIPAIGWAHDFQKVSARLFLPPGYRLLHATGIDNIPSTWLNRWTLLDIFIVLIFTIALAKLFGRPMAAIGLTTMLVLYHEPNAPRWIWLAILIGVALVRNIPQGKFLKAVKIYHLLTFLLLLIMAVPFSIKQIRVGIYPQLEKPWHSMSNLTSAPSMVSSPAAKRTRREADIVVDLAENIAKKEDRLGGLMKSAPEPAESKSSYYRRNQVAQYDPSMINQTGPGIPAWQWNTVHMNWSGPVERNQQIGLTLIGPKMNLFLAFVRVALLIVLALGIFGIGYNRKRGWQIPDPKSLLVMPLLFMSLVIPTNSQAAEIPSPEMFNKLQQRLLEKDDCFPACADIPRMSVEINPKELSVKFEVAAQVEVAIPLPGNPRHWLARAITIDNLPVDAVYRTKQGLWMIVPAGRHAIHLSGKVPPNSSLQLTLPLKPHRLKIRQTGWTSEGSHADGSIDNQLQFKRISSADNPATQILATGVLPPFTLVQRTLLLGLDWKVSTTIRRISPTGSAIMIEYPLLPGEAVLTEGIKVKDGKVQISLDPQKSHLQFESLLAKSEEITLRHAETSDWTEIWQVDASPIFHLEYDGIPVILHQVGNRWAPKWHPWPGEKLQLQISRPEGVKGQTITIDKSHLEVRPGQRATDSKLELSLRSSQGGQHTIILPPDSQLQEVKINGRIQSIRQEGRNIPLPISPGAQSITLKWRQTKGIVASYKTPEIDLGLPNANVNIDLHLPDNRWPLVVYGPTIGPAILFWSVILIIILIAFGLARSNLTHLRFYQWLLLGVGMSQSNLPGALLVVGWLIALEYRKKVAPEMDKGHFNLMQLGLGALTVLALLSLVFAISQGLLGHPDMNIVGNGSYNSLLRWYQDYSPNTLPQAWLLSIPLFWYRLAMLAWALWISFTLIRILRYGWQAFSSPVLWHQSAGKAKTADLPVQKDTMAKDEDGVDLSDELQVDE